MNLPNRANGLDGLRGLAAAAVVLLHVWMFSGAHQPDHAELTDQIVGSMGLALMMFFVLSGFLVAAPWIRSGTEGTPRPDLRRYAARRAARILPAYWLCLIGSFLVMRAIDHPLASDLDELPLFALFTQNQFTATAGQLNPPLWSLGVEVAFYAALPVIGVMLVSAIRRRGRLGALVVAAMLTVGGLLWTTYAHLTGDDPLLVAALPTYLPIFACGIAAAALVHGRAVGRPFRALLLVAGVLLVGFDGWWHADSTGFIGHVVRDLPAGVGFAMIAVAVAQGPAKLLGSLPLRRLGDYSYGIYLWHMPVLYVLRHNDRWPDSPWTAYALVMGIATVLGALSWYLMERHVVAWTSRRLGRAPARVPKLKPMPAPTPARAPVFAMAGGSSLLDEVDADAPPVIHVRRVSPSRR